MNMQEWLEDVETALHIAQTDRDKWKARAVKLAKALGIRDCDIDDYKMVEHKDPKKLCKDCKFFEYDHVENVDGIPLIVAHEICTKWGDGCRTSEDGFCFLFEPQGQVEDLQ